MRKRQIAVSTALTLAAAALTPLAAQADTTDPATYYVVNTCTGTAGTGTRANPFCSIQQAAAVATVPGDTVLIAPGQYRGEVDIAASGTATAPITFSTTPGATQPAVLGALATNAHALDIEDASYVNFSGVGLDFSVTPTTPAPTVLVHDSAHVTIDGNALNTTLNAPSAGGQPAVLIDGRSSNVTLSRLIINASGGVGVDVAATGSGNTVTTNGVRIATTGVKVDGAPGTVITSNTFAIDCAAISVADNASSTATGTSIENNLIDAPAVNCATKSGISLASAADTAGSVENYNTFQTGAGYGASEYLWAGTGYASQASFNAATGQGSADYDTVTSHGSNGSTPPVVDATIDAADSDAPGELPTGSNGAARNCDPNVLPSGTGHSPCYDRGAVENTDVLTATGGWLPPSQAPSDTAMTFSVGEVTSNWAGAELQYSYDFGDGTTSTGTDAASESHSYAANGIYSGSLTVTSRFGGKLTKSFTVRIVAPGPLIISDTVNANGGLGVLAGPYVSSAWTLTSDVVDWGDGSSTPVGDSYSLNHTYAHPGVYPVTLSATDASGAHQSTTTTFATAGGDYTAFGPTRLVDTRKGLNGTSAQLAHNGNISLKVAGVGGIPVGVTAVALNLTALDATGAGYISIQNEGIGKGTSTLNYNSGGGVYTNSVIAPVAADGTVGLTNTSSVAATTLDLLADISGYFAPEVASGYTPMAPARIMDTRSGLGGNTGKLAAGKADVLTVAGADKGVLPASGITAVAVNLTITGTAGTGYVAGYADGDAVPTASNENWNGNTTRAIAAIIPVGADGKVDIHNGGLAGSSADVIVDVTGYFSAAGLSNYLPVAPWRAFDTRHSGSPVAGDTARTEYVTEVFGYGNGGVTALVLNTTVTETNYPGWLAAEPTGSAPTTSSLNWTSANQTVANLAIIPTLGAVTPGEQIPVDFYNGGTNAKPVQVLGDLLGYFGTD